MLRKQNQFNSPTLPIINLSRSPARLTIQSSTFVNSWKTSTPRVWPRVVCPCTPPSTSRRKRKPTKLYAPVFVVTTEDVAGVRHTKLFQLQPVTVNQLSKR